MGSDPASVAHTTGAKANNRNCLIDTAGNSQ